MVSALDASVLSPIFAAAARLLAANRQPLPGCCVVWITASVLGGHGWRPAEIARALCLDVPAVHAAAARVRQAPALRAVAVSVAQAVPAPQRQRLQPALQPLGI